MCTSYYEFEYGIRYRLSCIVPWSKRTLLVHVCRQRHYVPLPIRRFFFLGRLLTYHQVHIRVIQKLAECLAQLLLNYDCWLEKNITFDGIML